MSIELSHLDKHFGAFHALQDIALTIPSGSLTGLLGPSGSGKTTLLRIIAGLEQADSGAVLFNGQDVTRLPVQRRRIGFVFQQYALFRHMTVADNVAFGLRMLPWRERPSRAARRERVQELLRMVQLEHLGERYPAQLSGGQRQRIALARALAVKPDVLLLDEPFGALDAKVRKELRRSLRDLHEKMGITTVFVTHDQEEAMELSDQVVVMSQGRIEQVGTPAALQAHPASRFVLDFLGDRNVLEGDVDGCRWHSGPAWMRLAAGLPSGRHRLYLPSHGASLATHASANASLPVRVLGINEQGPAIRVELAAEGWSSDALEVALPHQHDLGDQLLRGALLYLMPGPMQSVDAQDRLGPAVSLAGPDGPKLEASGHSHRRA